jgi:hypothetical protein
MRRKKKKRERERKEKKKRKAIPIKGREKQYVYRVQPLLLPTTFAFMFIYSRNKSFFFMELVGFFEDSEEF